MVAALRAGEADVGFVEADVDRAGIDVEPLHADELVVVAPATHRFAQMSEIALEDLAAEPLIEREAGSGTRRVAEEHLKAAGFDLNRLRVAAELSEIEAIKATVEAGLGVAILSRATLAKELELNTLVARPLAGAPVRRQVSAVTVSGAIQLPAVRELIELVTYA